MSGIFSTFNTANKGLQVQQSALHTTGHNISNANTEGFSRQRVDTKADLAYNYLGIGQLGTGVKIDNIVRMVDDYVNKQIRQENSIANTYSTKSDVLGQVEIIFNEPSDTGINANLGQMFDAWQELSKNPENLTAKTIVVEKSKTLANSLNHMSNQLNSLKDNTVEDIKKNVEDFNATIDKLDSLNKQIFNVSVKGMIPNDLLDQRDMLLRDLSGIAGITPSFDDKYSRVSIKLNGQDVLTTTDKSKMAIDKDAAENVVFPLKIRIGTEEVDITSGQIFGNKEGLKEIDGRMTDLNDFSKMMADKINGAHRVGGGGEAIFESIDSAGTIKISDAILADNSKIIAGATSNSAPGDGSRALAIASLRNDKEGTGTTIEGAYSNIVTKVGISKEYSDNMVSNQNVLLEHLVMRRESTSGVSIDEEVSNVVRFQKAYQANAKVISVLTDMLDTIINRMGV